MKTFMRITRLALAVGIGYGLASGTLAQTGNYDQALRELNIMRNIFNASFEGEDGRRFNPGPGEALYLANQGMVFTFDMPGRGWLNMPGLEKLQALNGANFDFDFDFDFDYDNGDPNANSQFAEYQQQMRDYNEQMRDKQEEMRDMQREMRDLQRQQRDEVADLEDDVQRLNGEIEVLGEEIGKLGESISESQEVYDTERRAQLATIRQAYATRIFGTLCDYGNTLRSLDSGQHVSIVLNDHEENQAQVYVVDYSALSACSSSEALQQGALSYTQPMR